MISVKSSSSSSPHRLKRAPLQNTLATAPILQALNLRMTSNIWFRQVERRNLYSNGNTPKINLNRNKMMMTMKKKKKTMAFSKKLKWTLVIRHLLSRHSWVKLKIAHPLLISQIRKDTMLSLTATLHCNMSMDIASSISKTNAETWFATQMISKESFILQLQSLWSKIKFLVASRTFSSITLKILCRFRCILREQ